MPIATAATTNWFDGIAEHDSVRALARRLGDGRHAFATVRGGTGSSAIVTVGALSGLLSGRPILLVTAHLDDADEAVDELRAMGVDARRFPALEVLPGETGVSPELLGERLAVVRDAVDGRPPAVIVAPIPALMQSIPLPERLDDLVLHLAPGDERGPGGLMSWLDAAGYTRVDSIENPGEFAVRGGLIDLYPAGAGDESAPVRLDFFGDELESITEIDLDTMASDRRVETVQVVGASTESLLTDERTTQFQSVLPRETVVALHELMEITEQGRGYYERAISGAGLYATPATLKALREFTLLQIDHHPLGASDPDATFDLPFEPLSAFSEDAKTATLELAEMTKSGRVVTLCANDAELARFRELLADEAPESGVESIVFYLHRGFVWAPPDDRAVEPARIAVVPYHELLHRYQTRRRIRRLRAGRAMDTFLDLQPGDFVVHRDHGIAKFIGLRTMDTTKADTILPEKRKGKKKAEGPAQEYLTLEFAKGAKLHVPAAKIELVQKYVGGFQGRPPLSHLGGKKWSNQKEQVAEAVRDLAAEMLRLHAVRDSMPGVRYPADTAWQKQFEAEFPYEETEDQLAALAEIKKDMSNPQPMDRLLCGDVGFGKTELAIRAAFKAAEYGRQVAVLVPTTVLAEQHARTFKSRFADYPFRVESLSRFQTTKESKEVLRDLARGQVDIIIGTHRLLSKDVKFADLGLVVIDEEQRFGVEHKQRLLQFRMTADVLTLSATPIPRTLHMAMLGLRDISSLTTPPLDRRAIVTEVIPYNEQRIQRALKRELAREGQVFFVHNRVHNIQSVADDVQRMVPDAKIIVGHGQMPDRELEKVMLAFIRGEADILVSTTIIESGIDIPNANTMIINDADRFGLAELHQLRGRVGRYKHRAYCYLLLSGSRTTSAVAAKRLKAIEEYSMLGAGFKIAMRDLEIRGAGNLLGAEQSGHIATVGYEMYCQLLERSVHELKDEAYVEPLDTEVEIEVNGSIPKPYIPSDQRRMEAYRRISQARTVEELEKVAHDLADAYGDPPVSVRLLLELAEIRVRAARMKIKSVLRREDDIVFRSEDPRAVARAFESAAGSVRIIEPRYPNQPFEVYFRPPKKYLATATLLPLLRKRLGEGDGDGETTRSSSA
ncbi:MAG: transcription-repair coupling factor [Phycisphaerales bacterium]